MRPISPYLLQYVLARVFGSTGALFERDAEQDIFAAVAHAGLGPKLLVRPCCSAVMQRITFSSGHV